MGGLGFALRYALRVLARDRAFTLGVVFVLGFGIAANTVGFSILNTVLLKDLHYKDADDLITVWIAAPESGIERLYPSPSDFRLWQDLQEKGRVFEDLAAFVNSVWVLEEGGYPENVSVVQASTHIHSMLGIEPIEGRTFLAEEGHTGRNHVAMISSSLWERKFSSAKNIIGQPITLDGVRHTLVGVFPDRSGLDSNNSRDVWTPLAIEEHAGTNYIGVLARLKPGVNVDQAREELLASSDQLGRDYQRSIGKLGVDLVPLHEWWFGWTRRTLFLIYGAALLVQLIAYANAASLFRARRHARMGDAGIRLALGGSPGSVRGHSLVECLLLTACGAAVGILAASWILDVIKIFLPATIPRLDEIGIDLNVVLWTCCVSVMTALGLVFVGSPAVSRWNLAEVLQQSRVTFSAPRSLSLRYLLLILQIAAALVLTLGSMLLTRSFLLLQSLEPGFQSENVLTMHLRLRPRYQDSEEWPLIAQQILGAAEQLPGVDHVGITHWLPLAGIYAYKTWTFEAEGKQHNIKTIFGEVNKDYFRSMQIPLIKGRNLTEADDGAGQKVVVVNEEMARNFARIEDAIGSYLTHDGTRYRIVGVIGNLRHADLRSPPNPQVYASYLQERIPSFYFVLNTTGDRNSTIESMRQIVARVDNQLALDEVRSMGEYVQDSLAEVRLYSGLLSGFAAVALILSVTGIYSLMVFIVGRRTRELAIRRALGASTGALQTTVLKPAVLIIGLGVAAGTIATLGLTRFLQHLLYGVAGTDAGSLLAVVLLLAGTGIAAAWIPAFRVARVEPMTVLRSE